LLSQLRYQERAQRWLSVIHERTKTSFTCAMEATRPVLVLRRPHSTLLDPRRKRNLDAGREWRGKAARGSSDERQAAARRGKTLPSGHRRCHGAMLRPTVGCRVESAATSISDLEVSRPAGGGAGTTRCVIARVRHSSIHFEKKTCIPRGPSLWTSARLEAGRGG